MPNSFAFLGLIFIAISTVQCGATEACFRICPLDDDSCMADQAVMIYAYNTEVYGKREVEFTMGGRLNTDNVRRRNEQHFSC